MLPSVGWGAAWAAPPRKRLPRRPRKPRRCVSVPSVCPRGRHSPRCRMAPPLWTPQVGTLPTHTEDLPQGHCSPLCASRWGRPPRGPLCLGCCLPGPNSPASAFPALAKPHSVHLSVQVEGQDIPLGQATKEGPSRPGPRVLPVLRTVPQEQSCPGVPRRPSLRPTQPTPACCQL